MTHPIPSHADRGAAPAAGALAGALLPAIVVPCLLAVPAQAGPVICTTTLEAPIVVTDSVDQDAPGPVEVTRCGVHTTAPELVQRRYYSWTSPFARGVDLTHQITDLFGIAMGGGDGTKVMGLGFRDQTILWDASAIENTTNVMMEDQSNPLPLRTGDLPTLFDASLSGEAAAAPDPSYAPEPLSRSWGAPVRGLW